MVDGAKDRLGSRTLCDGEPTFHASLPCDLPNATPNCDSPNIVCSRRNIAVPPLDCEQDERNQRVDVVLEPGGSCVVAGLR